MRIKLLILFTFLFSAGFLFAGTIENHFLYGFSQVQDTCQNSFVRKFTTEIADSTGTPETITVLFKDTVILEVKMKDRILPVKDYPLYEYQIFSPIKKEKALRDSLRTIKANIKILREKLFNAENDTDYIHEPDPEIKDYAGLLADEIAVLGDNATMLFREAARTGNTNDLNLAISEARDYLMQELMSQTDTTSYQSGTVSSEINRYNTEELLKKLDRLKQMIDSTTMLKYGSYLTNMQQLQLSLMQEQNLLSGLQDQYDLFEKSFGCEPLPANIDKTARHHKHRNKKHKKRKHKKNEEL